MSSIETCESFNAVDEKCAQEQTRTSNKFIAVEHLYSNSSNECQLQLQLRYYSDDNMRKRSKGADFLFKRRICQQW